jgi:hypothetical protein
MVVALDEGHEWMSVDPCKGGRWFGLGAGRNGGRLLDGRCDRIGRCP